MATFPAANSFIHAAGTNTSRGPLFEAWLAATKQMPGGEDIEFVDIAGGLLTPSRAFLSVDTEGNAASDDLDRIALTNYRLGVTLWLRCEDPGRKVRVRSGQGGSGQIVLAQGSELWLDDPSMWLQLLQFSSLWLEIDRSYGANKAQGRQWLGVADSATYPTASDGEAATGTAANRLLTPASLRHVLGHYQAFIGDRNTVTVADHADELLVGTSDGTSDIVAKITKANFLAEGFHRHFFSGEIAASPGAAGNAAHNLGGKPKLIQATLLNKTAEHGYSPGDEVTLDGNSFNGNTRTFTLGFNTTDCFWRLAPTNAMTVVVAAGTSVAAITPASWKLLVRAWR